MKNPHPLLKNAKSSSLGHFYIIEPGPIDGGITPGDFVKSFLEEYFYSFSQGATLSGDVLNHPDVHILGTDTRSQEKNGMYKVEMLEDFIKFFDFRPMIGERKFAIIENAEKMNSIMSNKLLKILEEPPSFATIFLLNPQKKKLLDTIHSRAIHLRVNSEQKKWQNSDWKKLTKDLQSLTFSEFLEQYQKSEKDLSYYSQELIAWETTQHEAPEAKKALLDWIQNFQEMNAFNQPPATKWALFYYHLKVHVLGRLRD